MTLCLNSFKGQHSSDLRPVNELPGGLAVQRQQQLPLIQTVHRRLVKAETRPSFLGLEEWIIDELNRLHILMLWGKVYGKESQRERESEVHQKHHLSCDSLPCDTSLLLCTAVLYLCVCSCTLFCTCLKARVACVRVFWLRAAIIKTTPAQATFFKFVWRI